MAYNPFDFFRKNQKIFFAVLTIIVMFMFVLSFGQGDFFSWFPRWLGAQKSSGDVQAEVDGSKVRASDLEQVNKKRAVANQFMSQLADLQLRAIGQKVQETQTGVGKMSEEARAAIRSAQFPIQILEQLMQFRQQTGQPIDPAEYAEQRREAIMQSRGELAKVITSTTLKSDDKEAAQAQDRLLQAELDFLTRAQAGGRRESVVYFANMPNRNSRDQLEYLLWLKKADKLGIRYTTEDVKELVRRELPDVSDEARQKLEAETVLGRDRRASEDLLYDALGDEFRVRAAQAAVIGTAQVRLSGGLPAPVPQELFAFYKQQTTPTRYTFLSVPVEPFIPQVVGEPTEQELKKIFNDYRYTEPDPASAKSGIKEPRKVKVAWAEVTGKEAYYGPLAEDRLKKATDSRLSLLFAVPFGAGVLGNAVAPVGFTDTRYDAYKQEQAEVAKGWAAPFTNTGLPFGAAPLGQDIKPAVAGLVGTGVFAHDAKFVSTGSFSNPAARFADVTVTHPVYVAAVAGLFSTGGANPLTVAGLMTETAHALEREQRLVAGVQAFHFPTLPGLAGLGELAGADAAVLTTLGRLSAADATVLAVHGQLNPADVAAVNALPKPLPQPLVQPTLDAKAKEELRVKVALDDVREWRKQLADILKKDDKTAAEKEAAELTAKFLKDRGLKTDATTDLRDMHALADAPAVAPLVQKSGLADLVLKTLTNSWQKSNFGATLFMRERPPRTMEEFQAQRPMYEPVAGVFDPLAYARAPNSRVSTLTAALPAPSEADPLTLVWRTEETKAETPRELDQATREKCFLVWKRLKARELARKACEDVVKRAAEAGESTDRLTRMLIDAKSGLQERLKPNGFGVQMIDDYKYLVAPLVPGDRSPTLGGGGNLQPFSLPRGDHFVYPTPKMEQELLANREKPVGTAVVLADEPETTYYVAVITAERDAADRTQSIAFREQVLRPQARENLLFGPRATVLARYAADARKDARAEAVALLKAEFGYTNEHPELDKRANEASE